MSKHAVPILVVAATALAAAAVTSSAANFKNIGPVLKNAPTVMAPPPAPRIYRFTIDSISISETRSLHEDTDVVGSRVKTASGQSAYASQYIGDVNNGTHSVGLNLDFTVQPGQPLGFTYDVFNSGYSWGTPIALNTALSLLLDNSVDTSFLLVGDCDGLVAKGSHLFSASDLASGKSFSGRDYTPGTDSSWGCGSNSKYYVNWSAHPL